MRILLQGDPRERGAASPEELFISIFASPLSINQYLAANAATALAKQRLISCTDSAHRRAHNATETPAAAWPHE